MVANRCRPSYRQQVWCSATLLTWCNIHSTFFPKNVNCVLTPKVAVEGLALFVLCPRGAGYDSRPHSLDWGVFQSLNVNYVFVRYLKTRYRVIPNFFRNNISQYSSWNRESGVRVMNSYRLFCSRNQRPVTCEIVASYLFAEPLLLSLFYWLYFSD
jgi:hypothetical protein